MSSQIPIKDKSQAGKLIKIARFKKEIRKTIPHKHNSYFEIIYLSNGEGSHSIDTVSYPVTPPVVYMVRKEQVHHWELENEPEGYVLILKKAFLDTSVDKELKDLLAKVSAFQCITLKEKETVELIFQLLVQEYRPEDDNNTPVIEGLLKALLAKISEMAKPAPPGPRKKANLYDHFLELLSQGQPLKNNVAYYATLLNTTPQNLNTACRKASGQSSAEVLAEFIINEAKRLLLYTDMTISEIAVTLAFKDNSHFVKYFKRHTDHTPHAFRSSI